MDVHARVGPEGEVDACFIRLGKRGLNFWANGQGFGCNQRRVVPKTPGRIGIAASKSNGAGSISAGSNTLVYLRFAVIGKLSGKFDSADLTSASTVLGEVNLEDELGKRIFTANARKGGRFVPALSF